MVDIRSQKSAVGTEISPKENDWDKAVGGGGWQGGELRDLEIGQDSSWVSVPLGSLP